MANPNPFTPEEVAQILEAFFAAVGTRQYIGARYVPIFGRKGEESIIWDNSAPYEPLTIVLYQGNSYTSRQYVPAGVAITNTEFWAQTGNYNAQIEQYRQTVLTFDSRINDEVTNRQDADIAINARIDEIVQQKKMLAFGDSWGNSVGEWPTELAKLMDLSPNTYCISGARFPFTQELATALQEHPSGQQDDIECAVVYGGVNNSATKLVADFTPWDTFIDTFREYFPNVRLYVFPMNVPTSLYAEPTYPDSYITVFNSMQNAYAHFAMKHWDNVFIIPNSNFMLNNESAATLFNTDMLHPNTYGSKVVAHNMYNAIHGRYQCYEIVPRAAIPTGVEIYRNAFVDQDGLHTPILKITKDALINDGEFLCYFNNYRVTNRIVVPFKIFSASNVLFQELSYLQMNALYNAPSPYFDIPINTASGINSAVLSGMEAGSYGIAESVLVPFVGKAYVTQ